MRPGGLPGDTGPRKQYCTREYSALPFALKGLACRGHGRGSRCAAPPVGVAMACGNACGEERERVRSVLSSWPGIPAPLVTWSLVCAYACGGRRAGRSGALFAALRQIESQFGKGAWRWAGREGETPSGG